MKHSKNPKDLGYQEKRCCSDLCWDVFLCEEHEDAKSPNVAPGLCGKLLIGLVLNF